MEIGKREGYRMDVLEKDYYVVLMLKELSGKQKEGLPAYFKGGTALYKLLKNAKRFSEDIDLSVDTRGCTGSQNKKRLNQATKGYVSMERDESAGRTNKSEVITYYNYDPVVDYDRDDQLQRFGRMMIEATSFTISEPVDEMGRLDGIPGVNPSEFKLFDEAADNRMVQHEYGNMLAIYVFKAEDRTPYDKAVEKVKQIHESLLQNKAWTNYKVAK